MANRIGVIESDEIERIGRLSVLANAGCNVVDAGSPEDAAQWSEADWRRFDVLLFGVTPDHGQWDRFGTLAVAAAAHEAHPNLRMIGLHSTGIHPLIRVRLAQTGLARVWPARLARTAEALVGLVNPRPHEADKPRRMAPDLYGAVAGPRSDPSAVLAYVQAEGLTEVFDHVDTQASTGLSRRAIIRLRRRITHLGDLSVPSGYATGGPCVDRSLPSWRSVVDYVNSARGGADDLANMLPGFPLGGMAAIAV